MKSLTVQRIECNNSLFDHYLKRALFWDDSKQFGPNGLTKKDIDDLTKAYGLYSGDRFVGFSLVKFDSMGNVVAFQSVVDSLKNQNMHLSTYLDDYIESMAATGMLDDDISVKKMKRS